MDHNQIVGFIWNIANLIRDHYKRSKYPDVILPFTVLRRVDCVLAPTKDQVYSQYTRYKGQISDDALAQQLRRAAGFVFYNTSRYDFGRLLQDQDAIYANTINYINGFSDNMREVLDNFKLRNTVEDLHEAGLLYLIVQSFAQLDLHPDVISNHQMGTIFEELIRRFNEASNENPGEHFTPRDVVRLMVDLLLAGDEAFLQTPGRIIKLSDPCAGTGGMLTIGKERIEAINPAAQVYLYGQEVNPETYAVCKADLYMKSADGRDAEGIAQGSTLAADQHRGEAFHYQITNPPYGKDWRIDEKAVRDEAKLAHGGRFGAGLPRTSDGQLLFLQHMLAHRFDAGVDHSRVAIIMNGSPLFTGDAGSGESEIRRWIIANDWLEAIIALPEQLFYNTGIATYIWILTNAKPAHRKGKVQLIDATALWEPLRKSLGDKRREISEAQRAQIVQLYLSSSPLLGGIEGGLGGSVRLFDNADFGFRKITVERPLRLNFQAGTAAGLERIARLDEQRAFQALAESRKKTPAEKAAEAAAGRAQQKAIRAMLRTLPDALFTDRAPFLRALNKAAQTASLSLTQALRDAILAALGERDPAAAICLDAQGRPEPDPDLRDTERVPLTESVEDYFAREVLPHVPDLPAPRPKPGEFCIYVLKCADGSFYIGQTDDFSRRLHEHESGAASWTAPRRPVEPIHWEIFSSRDQAVEREKELKTGFGRKWLKRQYSKGLLAATARQAGAWISAEKRYCDDQDGLPGKVGYEINFNRYFYQYTPPRPLEAIEADIRASQERLAALLKDVL